MQVIRVTSAECRPEISRPRSSGCGPEDRRSDGHLYGLAVDPSSDAAVHNLFELKGRRARAALPLVAASSRQVEALCGQLGSAAARLAAAFWPGPLSLVFDAPASVSVAVHGGSRTLAIRVPDHPVQFVGFAERGGGGQTGQQRRLDR